MTPIIRNRSSHNGQSLSETVVLMPFYLLIVFGILQLGQLGTALIVVNYGASTVARQMVKDDWTGSSVNPYEVRFNGLLSAGMKNGKLEATRIKDSDTSLLSSVRVHACAEISAFPFVGHLVAHRLANGSADQCAANAAFAFNTGKDSFVVHAQSMARMNYQP